MENNLLLTNAHILTMDADLRQFSSGALALSGSTILAVGETADLQAAYPGFEQVDCQGQVLMPGLVNAHTHVPMTLLRGLADDLRLDVWLMGYMMPVEREFVSPDFVRLGTRLACAEMIRGGVTCFADMYYFEDDIAAATAEAGLRAVCGQSVLKFPTPDAASYEESLAYARAFIQKWKGHPLIVPAVAPHAPYTCTPEILKACTALALEFDVPLHIHIAETAGEVENMRAESGMPVVPYVKKQGVLEARVIAAHCVHIDEGEIRTLQHARAGAAHNPSSNLKLASGFAPVRRMLELGLNVGIGTDGPASNNDLDMFEEMRLAAFLSKGASGDPTSLPARTVVLMATRLGAQALHIGHLTGSLEPGKRADLILVDLQRLHTIPHFQRDPNSTYARIVYAARSSDVTAVMVDGRWLLRGGQLLTIDEAGLIADSRQYAGRIDAFLIQREKSVLSKLIAIGGAAEQESFEVQIKVPFPGAANAPGVSQAAAEAALAGAGSAAGSAFEVLRRRHYREYDTYFFFDDPTQGSLRYREDDFIAEDGSVNGVRSRLTLLGQARERALARNVLLSRGRYLAPAAHSLRFYREYFKPVSEREIVKDRFRYLVRYQGVEFFVNFDHIATPEIGDFLEIKSRTWSRQDAAHKSRLAVELIRLLGASPEAALADDYVEIGPPSR